MRPSMLLVGSLPPPYGGPESILEGLLENHLLNDSMLIYHLSMRQPTRNNDSGKMGLENIVKNIQNLIAFAWNCFIYRPRFVYYVLAQNTLGCLRDGLFIAIAKLFGCKIVGRRGGGDFDRFYQRTSPWLQHFIRWALKKVDLLTVESPSLVEQYKCIMPEEKIIALPTGIPPIRLGIRKNELGRNDKSVVEILFLGNISKAKGAVDLVKSIHIVRCKVDCPVHLTVAGEYIDQERNVIFIDSPHGVRKEIEELLSRFNLHKNIDFPGPVYGEEKIRLFQKADIFVLPSYSEGLSVSLLEAMSARLPIVATRVGGSVDLIVDGINGYLVEPGDYQGIAKALVNLIRNPDLRKRMGENNEKLFLSQYHIDLYVKRLLKITLPLLNQ